MNRITNVFLTWLLKWIWMVPWNLLQIIWWYHIRILKRGPELTALRATWDASYKTSRPVFFRSTKRSAHPEWPAYIKTLSIGYIIYVNPSLPLSPYSTIHEVLHLLLTEEGYYWPVLPLDALGPDPEERQGWLSGFSNSLHHPEIYRRMEDVYELPMNDYWIAKTTQACEKITEWADGNITPEYRLKIILFLFSWFFIPQEVAGNIREAIKMNFPDEFAVCQKICGETHEMNLSIYESEDIPNIEAIIKRCCLEYAEDQELPQRYERALNSLTFNDFHKIPVEELEG